MPLSRLHLIMLSPVLRDLGHALRLGAEATACRESHGFPGPRASSAGLSLSSPDAKEASEVY